MGNLEDIEARLKAEESSILGLIDPVKAIDAKVEAMFKIIKDLGGDISADATARLTVGLDAIAAAKTQLVEAIGKIETDDEDEVA